MKSKLERKWWYTGSTGMLALALTYYVMALAGIPEPDNAARVTLFFFCLVGFERCLSFVGWLLVLWASPSRALET